MTFVSKRRKPIKVLSLFDGISVARLAIHELGHLCEYYASETDKYCIEISKKNWPDIVHVGDARNITRRKLFIDHDVKKLDLIIGGSPCQDLSRAGKRKGLNGDRSKLFWEYARILRDIRHKFFIFENVASMTNSTRDFISELFRCEPIIINSNLLTAQNRVRYYWTNIDGIEQPEDQGITLQDVIGKNDVCDREKSYCIDHNYSKGINEKNYHRFNKRQIVYSLVEKRSEEAKKMRREYMKKYGKDYNRRRMQDMYLREDGKANCITASLSQNHNVIFTEKGIELFGVPIKTSEYNIRKLTPEECERLQGFPTGYTEGVSNTQRYRAIGNAFTAPVIEHILSYAFGYKIRKEK